MDVPHTPTSPHLLLLQEEKPQWRKDQVEGVRVPVKRDRRGFDAANVPLAAAPVKRGVAVQQLFPESRFGGAHAVVVTGDRREIASHDNRIVC